MSKHLWKEIKKSPIFKAMARMQRNIQFLHAQAGSGHGCLKSSSVRQMENCKHNKGTFQEHFATWQGGTGMLLNNKISEMPQDLHKPLEWTQHHLFFYILAYAFKKWFCMVYLACIVKKNLDIKDINLPFFNSNTRSVSSLGRGGAQTQCREVSYSLLLLPGIATVVRERSGLHSTLQNLVPCSPVGMLLH